jgi:hypothetical protein
MYRMVIVINMVGQKLEAGCHPTQRDLGDEFQISARVIFINDEQTSSVDIIREHYIQTRRGGNVEVIECIH